MSCFDWPPLSVQYQYIENIAAYYTALQWPTVGVVVEVVVEVVVVVVVVVEVVVVVVVIVVVVVVVLSYSSSSIKTNLT